MIKTQNSQMFLLKKQQQQQNGGVFLLEMAVNQDSHWSRVSDERSSNFA